jgi:hypothetical protein
VLAQVDRLSDRFEAVRVLVNAGDAKRFGDRARVEDQAIPRELLLVAVSRADGASLRSSVNGGDNAYDHCRGRE